jgi:hypothetical protein
MHMIATLVGETKQTINVYVLALWHSLLCCCLISVDLLLVETTSQCSLALRLPSAEKEVANTP